MANIQRRTAVGVPAAERAQKSNNAELQDSFTMVVHPVNRNSHGWTLVASFFKALMRAIDGRIVFGLFLFPLYYFLERANVRPLFRWLIVSNSAIIHQVVYEANERFQTLACGRAIPNYSGDPNPYGLSWWYNFLILDFLAYELTSLPAVAGIQVISLYLY